MMRQVIYILSKKQSTRTLKSSVFAKNTNQPTTLVLHTGVGFGTVTQVGVKVGKSKS